MNNKGFTLTELLATIAILAIITSIATFGIMAVANSIKKNMLDTKKEIIIKGATLYGQENRISLTGTCQIETETVNNCKVVSVADIQEKYLNTKDKCGEVECFKNNVTDKDMKDDTIAVYVKYNRIYAKFIQNFSDEV